MKEHNKNFYSLEELKRTRDSLEGYLDNEEVYYFVGTLRYACDEIERLKDDNKYLNKVNIELSSEKNRLNSIIKEVREYINKIPTQPVIRVFKKELLEILDKEKE